MYWKCRIFNFNIAEDGQKGGVLFDATQNEQDQTAAATIAIIEKFGKNLTLYFRPSQEEARRIVIGYDEEGYFVAYKLLAREEDFVDKPKLKALFDALQPIQMPVAV